MVFLWFGRPPSSPWTGRPLHPVWMLSASTAVAGGCAPGRLRRLGASASLWEWEWGERGFDIGIYRYTVFDIYDDTQHVCMIYIHIYIYMYAYVYMF